MRHNGRPCLLASALPPNKVSFYPGARPMVVCSDCDTWCFARRGLLTPHRADDGVSRCLGSAQRVIFDITPAQWLMALRDADLDAARRRSARTFYKPQAPVAPAVCRIAAAR